MILKDIDTQAQTQITSDSGLDNTQSEHENMDADDSAAQTQLIQGRDWFFTNWLHRTFHFIFLLCISDSNPISLIVENSQSPRKSRSRSGSAESEKRMSNAGSR